jgi:hypothetical protein
MRGLRKLVIDDTLALMRAAGRSPWCPSNLREGFERLVNLEESVDTQGELYLHLLGLERAFIWPIWSKLERKALGGVSLVSAFWEQVAPYSFSETLFVSVPDEMRRFDTKVGYVRYTNRRLRFVILTTPSQRIERYDYLWYCDWEILDPTFNMSANEYLLPYCLEGGSMRSVGKRCHRLIWNVAEDGFL